MRACSLSFLGARLLLCVLPSCGCPVPNVQLVRAITHAMRQDNTYDHTIDTILSAPCAVLHVANIQKAFNNTTCNKTPIIPGDMLSKGSTHVPPPPHKPNPFHAALIHHKGYLHSIHRIYEPIFPESGLRISAWWWKRWSWLWKWW
jgi:hypothetical protein